jgi:hypothetical protein
MSFFSWAPQEIDEDRVQQGDAPNERHARQVAIRVSRDAAHR